MFIRHRRSARPMLAFARCPGPSAPQPEAIGPQTSRAGPLTMITGPIPCVVDCMLSMSNSGFADCPHGGQHDREVLGAATGHDGVDRDLLDRRLAGADHADDDVRVRLYPGEQGFDPLLSGDHDRQAVGPLAHMEDLERSRLVRRLVARGAQGHRWRPSSRSMMPGAAFAGDAGRGSRRRCPSRGEAGRSGV